MKLTIAKGVLTILAGASLFLINSVSWSNKSLVTVETKPDGKDSFYDLSSWKEENVKELFDLSVSVQDEDWPMPPFTARSDEKERRRLAEGTDRWKAEEEEMRKEFLQLRKESFPPTHRKDLTVPKKSNTNRSNKIASNRDLQELPPVSKTCTEPNDPDLGCPPPDLAQKCDKYNEGDFESCFNICKQSVCCTHDSKRRETLSCAETAINCQHWIPCYIVWWKLSDTNGPATFLRMLQDDTFFNVDVQVIKEEYNDPQYSEFYNQWFQRFIDDDAIELSDDEFEDPTLWSQYHNS